MAYNKGDLIALGTSLRDTLASVGQTIHKNKLDAKKEEILNKYKNPDSIMFDSKGNSKSPNEIAEKVFPDAQWLIGNGYTNEANFLGNTFKEFNAQLNTREQNRAFIKSLPSEQQSAFNGTDLDRTNTLNVYKTTKNTGNGGYKGSHTRTIITHEVKDGKNWVVVRAYDPSIPIDKQSLTEISRELESNMTNYNVNSGTNVSIDGSPEQIAYIDPKTKEITYHKQYNSVPQGQQKLDDYLKQQKAELELKNAEKQKGRTIPGIK